jgi:Cu/Ag efflux pump CusA
MTALAMIIGMVPMALGLGDGGEENAPLGRAVIGGLMCATSRRSFSSPRSSVCFIGIGKRNNSEIPEPQEA